MKILVLQLARLGDIYQSWPALRALRRSYPGAQIDIVVRPKFEGAVAGLHAISNTLLLPTEDILKPLLDSEPDIATSTGQVDRWLNSLITEKYDWVINLSFSPASSYIVHALKSAHNEVTGYTRHQDGFFDISGEIASYFYAQVGIGKYNRFHLADLMAGLMGVELSAEDWKPPTFPQKNMEDDISLPEQYVVLHVGSSEAQKTLPAFRWARILAFFQEQNPQMPVVLIGSKAETPMADLITLGCRNVKIIDLVGRTSIQDIFGVLEKARLLVGCDSAPMHIAAFTKTPCLNLSIGHVNFWETGPRSPRSFILRVDTVEQVVSEHVGNLIKEILEGGDPVGLIKCIPENPCYLLEESVEQKFGWELILAMYMGHPFPATEDITFFQGVQKLHQVNEVILENLAKVTAGNLARLKPVLDRSDEIIDKLAEMVPILKIYSNWLKAERARVQPGNIQDTIAATVKMHATLKSLVRPYVLEDKKAEQGEAYG